MVLFNKWLKYSYADQKTQTGRVRNIILWVILCLAIYLLFTNFFFPVKALENNSMQPDFNHGDRFIFYSFGIHRLLPDVPPFNKQHMHRGNVVLVNKQIDNNKNIFLNVLNRIARFWTAGRMGIPGREEQLFIKRVIGLPGDTISMSNYVLRVQSADNPYTFTEFELSDSPYNINIPQVPALWDSSIPFSGNMEKIVLGDNQCFVVSDDRSNSNDSRTWGPIPKNYIIGKALLRYWPLNKIKLL
ncbi:signal peptidase I [Spirochaetia bacterium]|nr:signal peptidase I [Spirochaetia bacterium]